MDTFSFYLYKRYSAGSQPSLTPFFRMLWEHGITFTESQLPYPLTWEAALEEKPWRYPQESAEKLALHAVIPLLQRDGGEIDLYDRNMLLRCWIEWTTTPTSGESVFSLELAPLHSALDRHRLAWNETDDESVYLLARYQQAMASLLHWGGVCCQWFQPELAGSYVTDHWEYMAPKSLLTHLENRTFPAWGDPDWGWAMYTPTKQITPALLETFSQTPFLTMTALPPVGLLVSVLPGPYRYETRAAQLLERAGHELSAQSLRTAHSVEEAIQELQAEAELYQRAIMIYQSAQDSSGEAMARGRIQQMSELITHFRRMPTFEEREERIARLKSKFAAQRMGSEQSGDEQEPDATQN